MVCCSLAREIAVSINRTYDRMLRLISNPTLYWGGKCHVEEKPIQKNHGIIVSLSLICCIHCRVSISYLSIPGIVTHDWFNISHNLTFSFQFQCHAVRFIYILIFQEDSKWGSVVGYRRRRVCFITICFIIRLINFS